MIQQNTKQREARIEELEQELARYARAEANNDNLTVSVPREDGSASPVADHDAQPNDKRYIRNVERENRLMSSAFHDLAARLQLNNAVVQRKAEPPKSWLGRQRRFFEGPAGLVR